MIDTAKLDAILNTIDFCEKDIAYKENRIVDCNKSINILKNQQDLIIRSRAYLKKATDYLYENSIVELESIINDVVSAIFYDEHYTVKIEISDSYSKSIQWWLIDHNKNIKFLVDGGTGRGLRAVVSFIIQSYFLLSLGSHYMFIDEEYQHISEAYIGKFFEYVNLLATKKNLCLATISHDDRFKGHEDAKYIVSRGEIEKC